MSDIFCPECMAILTDAHKGHITVEEAERRIRKHGDRQLAGMLKSGAALVYVNHEEKQTTQKQ